MYLREVSSDQWESIIGQDTQTDTENQRDQGKKKVDGNCKYTAHIT